MKRSLIVGSGILLGFAGMGTALDSAAKERLIDTSSATIADLGPAASDAVGAELLGRIEAKWSGVMSKVYRWDAGAFQQFREGYRNYPASVLEEALGAATFERMQSTLGAYATLRARDSMAKALPTRRQFDLSATTPDIASNELVIEAKQVAAKALGEDGKDLVFVPITPCTVWDTRFAAGPPYGPAIGDGQTRRFYSHWDGSGGDFSAYGGNPACTEANETFIGGRPYAVMMTIYVNNPVGQGWLTFYRDGDPDPSQATISVYYSPGPTRTQMVVSKSSRNYGSGSRDVAVTGRFSTADASASVVGYFIKPGATALQCTSQSAFGANAVWANGSAAEVNLPACGVGYTQTGVMCGYSGTAPAGVSLRETGSYGYCEWMNASGGALNSGILDATLRCCRVPGR